MRILFLLFLPLLLMTSCHIGRTVIWNFGDYNDYKKFDHESISKSNEAYKFEKYNTHFLVPDFTNNNFIDYTQGGTFEEFLIQSKTTSFYVLIDSTIVYYQNLNGYKEDQLHCVNSVSKSFISLLIGIAIEEGKIYSIDDPIKNYISEFKNEEVGEITIRDLIDMQSGIKFSEQYFNPFGNLSKFYYGTNIRKYTRNVKTKRAPGKFEYISVNTDILGWVLEEAIGQSVPSYLEEKVWKPLKMENDATWSVDSKKRNVPKFSYGLNTRSIDLLKLGYLYLNNGRFKGKQIVSKEWIDQLSAVDSDLPNPNYKNHWWLEVAYKKPTDVVENDIVLETIDPSGGTEMQQVWKKVFTGNYYAAGFLGQFIYVNPEKNMVIVRTGKKQGKVDWINLFKLIGEQIDTPNPKTKLSNEAK